MTESAIADGRAAWARLQEHQRRSWSDWVCVGRALIVGRTAAMAEAQANRPMGSKYNRLIGQWLAANGLSGISTQERYRAINCVEKLPAIEAWRNSLTEAKRSRFNHPHAVWQAWQAAASAAPRRESVISKTKKRPAASGYKGVGIQFSQDQIRRVAMAMRERWSTDIYILARIAAEALIRDQADLLALLPQPPKPRAPRKAAPEQHAQA